MYKSKFDIPFFLLIISPIIIALLYYQVENVMLSSKSLLIYPLSFAYITFFYILPKKTFYILDEKELIIQSFWLKKTILYTSILSIETSPYLLTGYKYGFAFNGLKIKQKNSQLSIFISPVKQASFLKKIEQIRKE